MAILALIATFPGSRRRAKFTMPRQASERQPSMETIVPRISSDDSAH